MQLTADQQTATDAIKARLARAELGATTSFGSMQVVALVGPDQGEAPGLATEALLAGSLVIEEMDRGGVVPALRARNGSDKALLLLLGDELLGGKQHRVVNTNVLVRAGHDVVIPVSCIQAGRWGGTDRFKGRSLKCRRAPLSVNAGLRSRLARQTHSALRTSGRATSDQQAVWREVDRFSTSAGVNSRTSSLADALDALEQEDVAVEAADRQIGFAAWAGDRLVALELFSCAALLRGALRRLLISASADVNGTAERQHDVVGATADLLSQLQEVQWQTFDGVGDGADLRAKLGDREAASLVAGEHAVTLSVLAA